MFAALLCLVATGCGGGYPGGGLGNLTAAASVIDAGQAIPLAVVNSSGLTGSWTITTASCGTSGCGTLASTTGNSDTYTAPQGVVAPFQVTVQAAIAGTQSAHTVTITVNPDPVIHGAPPAGTVGVPYSTTLSTTGGTGAVALSLSAGSLPAGLSFNPATGVISGTPTAPGTANFTAQATDSSSIPFTTHAPESITVVAPGTALTVLGGNPPSGVVGTPYSTALVAAGGTAPYTWSLAAGSLPAGLTLSSTTGVISGTPTAQGTSTFTAQVHDATGATATGSFSITITTTTAPLAINVGTLPNGAVSVPYSATIGVSGGTAPYSCAITSGTLPNGLALGAGCVVSGTPTMAGTANLTVKATDSSSPNGTTSGPVTLTIGPAPLTLSTGALPNGTINTPYSSTIGVSGGTAPYTCTITSGALQTGLTLGTNCLVSGTPTMAGTVNLMVRATDSGNPNQTTTGPVALTINPTPLSLGTGGLPNGTVGTPYSSTIGVNGGTSPYACTITSGTLPAGLSLGANCLVSGTPTVAGMVTLMVRATDSGNPAQTANGPVPITINPAPVSLTLTPPAAGTIGTPYSGTVGVSGGTGPYTCTLNSGTLQTGLTLNANCTVTGTPSTSGTANIGVQATDSSHPGNSTTSMVPVTINPASTTLTLTNPPTATVGTPYTGTIGVTGGPGPYSCTLVSGTLPAGLTLGAGCTVTGTPTTAGPATVMVQATDSNTPADSTTAPVTVTVQPIQPLTLTGSLPNGTVGQPYTQTLTATGGVGPYTYAVTAGAPPAGLTLSTGGVLSGTPTTPGASSFTVTATDSEGAPMIASLPLVLLITYPATANDGLLNGPYAFLFQGYDDVVSGVLAYQTATVGSFTANGTGALTAGELDANHQASNPTGTTVPTRNLLGTYTIGADDRGTLVISALAADGTVALTNTYAIAVKAPVAPATTTAHGTMIEADANVVGTRGSGTFLQQTATAFTTGFNGSYAFGMQGDTPCLPACTAGLQAGPVATVGQIAASAGAIGSGEGDTNISQNNYPTAALSGTVGAADANGRVQLSLTNPAVPFAAYPVDYAIYVVNANQALVMSTDKHSAYILLAGSATLQTQSTFANASLTGAYVGYENSPTNPGLAGVAVQNVLNLPTATIIRGTANGTGTCTTTNVDVAGTTGLVNGLSGQGSGSNTLNALLGTYQSTGNSNCTVGTNGRAIINYPVPNTVLTTTLTTLGLSTNPPAPRVAYLTGPNAGYFLETGYAGLGMLEQQVGAPFSLATLNGTYTYGTAPAASLASLNASGVFTADGAGQANYTFDENVGVGNINAITLGMSASGTYVLTDATAGRFVLGASTVIYAINPGRFVLLDTSATNTSPSVALIY